MKTIDTESISRQIRNRLLNMERKEVLISYLRESNESEDKYTLINCDGYGRLRVFKEFKLHLYSNEIFKKPLFRNHPPVDELRTQAFQLGGCNWRCWYCFVDYGLLDGDKNRGKYFTADELIELYLKETDCPLIIDLTGGQPDLVPEWNLWMLEAIEKKGLKGSVYVWIDDNLSSFYLWEFLTKQDVEYIAKFLLANRVGCLKGYNYESFIFNTNGSKEDFDNQFRILSRLLESGFDIYSYATFTTPSIKNLAADMSAFVEKLSTIHSKLPLRIIPLRIHNFKNAQLRSKSIHIDSMELQHCVIDAWEYELLMRFSIDEIKTSYSKIKLNNEK